MVKLLSVHSVIEKTCDRGTLSEKC